MKNKKILFLVNNLSSFLSNRVDIALKLKKLGFDVHVAYGEKGNFNNNILKKKNIISHFCKFDRSSINPFKEVMHIIKIYNLLKHIRPNLVHLVTIKPYLYGSISARLLGIHSVVCAVAGLGTLFISEKIFYRFIRVLLYPIFFLAFNHKNQKVIFQNKHDKLKLISWGVIRGKKTVLIKGSGVNLKKFNNFKEAKGLPIICFASRLLKDKGILEFIEAIKLLKLSKVNFKAYIAGDFDKGNPTSLTHEELNKYLKNTPIVFKGHIKNIAKLYSKSHIICLPSYREGFPKSLIEAAASGRPVVTTNVPGCRDAIIPNKSGYLVPAKNVEKLSKSLKKLILNPALRIKMGKENRKYAKKEFNINTVIEKHIKIYKSLLINI